MCDCYFELVILLIILFETQQVVSRLRFKWKQWSEKKARLQELRSLMKQTLNIGGCNIYGKKLHLPFLGKKPENTKDED